MIHDFGASAIGRDWQSTSDDFPQRGKVWLNLVEPLRAAVTKAKAGDHLIEDQQRAVPLRYFSQSFKKSRRRRNHPHVCRYRLDYYRGNFAGMSPESLLHGGKIVVRNIQR